jgi:hypothetical protein
VIFARRSKDDIDADVAELCASRPAPLDEFSDADVQMRMAMLITLAMNTPTKR